ncbi:factor of DNA methylation 1-like [Macadamia integrifolia]|uniref:factor of DNA methylation 1-like n=1 Tax=Macadamia integrifolia TaxID=60698 RepID=UPI001C52E574|nr:factor of DNA methylation 1-like [Macadamia integrifolia]
MKTLGSQTCFVALKRTICLPFDSVHPFATSQVHAKGARKKRPGGPVGDYLHKNGDLKTVADIAQEATEQTKIIVANLTDKLDVTNDTIDELEYKFHEKTMSLSRTMEEKDRLHQSYNEEMSRLQNMSRDHTRRILEENEMLRYQLDSQRRKLELRSKELNKREALNELERRKQDEEIEKNVFKNNSLHIASMEQKKADENVLRLIEEQKWEKEAALSKILELEKQLDAKQKLELEIEELKGNLEVMKHMVGEDDTGVQKKMMEMNEQLNEKIGDLKDVEDMHHALIVKERQSNNELQEASQVLIEGLQDMLRGKMSIGIKKMGEVNPKPFQKACKKKFPCGEASVKSMELCSLWQEEIKNSGWYPFKIVTVNGTAQEDWEATAKGLLYGLKKADSLRPADYSSNRDGIPVFEVCILPILTDCA